MRSISTNKLDSVNVELLKLAKSKKIKILKL